MERKVLHGGEAIKFVDQDRVEHDALVTCVHSQTCINLVYVTKDYQKSDTYGLQLERSTSVCHRSLNNFGNYFYQIDEA